MAAYDDVVIEPQFVLTSEAAIKAAVFIVTNNKGYINVICCLVSKGPFIYYVSTINHNVKMQHEKFVKM